MNAEKKKRLESVGFRVGTAADFLGLTLEEQQLVSLRLKLSRIVRARREQAQMTQLQLAKRLASSQSRVAKLENNSSAVSLDLLFRGLFAVGGTLEELVPIKKMTAKTKGPRTARRKVHA